MEFASVIFTDKVTKSDIDIKLSGFCPKQTLGIVHLWHTMPTCYLEDNFYGDHYG